MTGTLSIVQFSKICLFCLLESPDLELICNVPSVEIFWKVSGVQNLLDLPQKICPNCVHLFQSFTKFIKECLENFNKLKSLYETCANKSVITSRESINHEYCSTGVKGENNDPQFKCETCKSKFNCLENLVSHIREKVCVEESHLSYDTQRGPIVNSTPKQKCCKHCKTIFQTKAQLVDHYKKSCQVIDYSCLQCDKTFKKKQQLNAHMGCHTKDLFKCPECNKGFRFQQNLKRHLLIHEGIKKFTCDYCGKAFSRAHVLREHKNIHTGHNPYVCNYCGKGFKRYANHFIHVHRHKLLNGEVDQNEDTKLYLKLKCDICNRIFASRGALQNHLALHNNIENQGKNFLCTDCGKGFNTKGQLDSHMRTHTGYAPYECKQCGKKFKQKSAFNNHSVVHSGEKPYQCTLCQKYFTQSAHLKIHMRLHSGEKPFSCNFCQKTFTLKGNLKVHLRTHTGEKPFNCSVCSKSYYNSTSLKKHAERHSNIKSVNCNENN